MSARPVEDALEEPCGLRSRPLEALGQRHRFRLGEIAQLDAPADVERRGPRIADQVRWGHNAQQAEGQTGKLGVFAAPVVTFPDGCEKLIGGERQAANRVDLVYK